MTSDAVAVRQACVTAAVDLARAGLVPVEAVLIEAHRIERYARTGWIPPRPLTARLTWGAERPRTTGEDTHMPGSVGEVHRGAELPYHLELRDAVTGAAKSWAGVASMAAVDPAEAGQLTPPDENGNGVFRANPDSGVTQAAVSVTIDPEDGGDSIIAAGSVQVDPDGTVVEFSWGAERPRT